MRILRKIKGFANSTANLRNTGDSTISQHQVATFPDRKISA